MTTETAATDLAIARMEAACIEAARMETGCAETLTANEACYLLERIKYARQLREAAAALAEGKESLHWAISKASRQTMWAVGTYGRELTKERKAKLTKMAAAA